MTNVDQIQQAGPYKLNELMGSNGVVATWNATGSDGNPAVVVCMMRQSVAQPDLWDKVEQAAQAIQSGQPSGVLIPEMWGHEGGVYFMAYPFIEGVHLGKNVNERGLPPALNSIGVIIQVLESIASLQSLGLSHRVLTPASIFLSPDGQVKLLHGGWSHILLAAADGPANENMMSNLPFLAPEVIGYEPSDTAADIYSVGANLYFLLTGQPTHWEDDPKILAQSIQTKDIDFSSLQTSCGEDLADLIEEMLERDPEDRPLNIEALINRLQISSEGLPSEEVSFSEQQTMAAGSEQYGADDTRPPSAAYEEMPTSEGNPSYEDQGEYQEQQPDQQYQEGYEDPNQEYESSQGPVGTVTNAEEDAPMSAAQHRQQNQRSQRQQGIAKAQQLAAEAQEQKQVEIDRQNEIEAEKARIRLEKKKKAIKLGILGGIVCIGIVAIGGLAYYISTLDSGGDEQAAAIQKAAEEQKKKLAEQKAKKEAAQQLVTETENQLRTIGQYNNLYFTKYGTWPSNADNLKEVTEDEIVMTDSWGNELEIRPQGFVMSSGVDGKMDTDDDMWIDSENMEVVSSSDL